MPSPRALVATPYRRGVLVLAVLTLCWRAWTIGRWSWTNDDWFYLHDAATTNFWPYLTQDYNGHLMPGGFLFSWLFTQLAPLNFWLPVVFVTGVSTGSVLVWGVALGRIAGERIATLAPLAVVSLSAIYLRPTVWWAAATQSLTMLFFMGWGILLAERWNRAPSRRGLVALLVVYATGLLFWQKAVILILPIAAVLIGVANSPLRQRIGSATRPLVGLVVLTSLYVPAYLGHTSGNSSNNSIEFDRSALDGGGFEALARAFGEVLAPGLFGGPWGTLPVNGNPLAHPPVLQSWAMGILAVAIAIAAVARRRRNWLPISMAVAYALVAWGMILLSNRFLLLREATLTDERFNADVLAAAVVAVALVMRSARLDRAASRSTGAADREVLAARRHMSQRFVPTFVGALLVSLVVANVSQVRRLEERPDQKWTAAILSDLAEREGPVTIWDANTPESVFPVIFYPEEALLSYVLAPLAPKVKFREVTERLTLVDEQGHLQGVQVSPSTESEPWPVEGCGYSVSGTDPVVVPMTSGLFYWDWAIQVNAMASEDSTVVLTVGDSVTRIPIKSGLNQYQVQVATDVPEQVELTSAPGSSTVCVAEILVGNVEPVDD